MTPGLRGLVFVGALGCGGDRGDGAGDSGDSGNPPPTAADPCDAPPRIDGHLLSCDAGALQLAVWIDGGCPAQAQLDLWDPALRHERHPLREVDGVWVTGPLVTDVRLADWTPGAATAIACDAENTFAITVDDRVGRQQCVSFGASAAAAPLLPGAAATAGCTVSSR